jgi:predicted nucleic acid-binding Zn ribbon protein
MCAQPLAGVSQTLESAEPDQAARSNRSTVLYLNPTSPRKCPVCEAINSPEYVYCQDCGSNLNESRLLGDAPTVITSNQPPLTRSASPSRAPASPDHLQAEQASGLKRACPKCGNAVGDDSLFCNRCGTQLPASRTVAMSSIKSAPRHRLVLIVDGQETDEEFELNDENIIGRLKGDITFPYDDFVSGNHARIVKQGNKYYLSDTDSRNGTFIRIKEEVEIKPGDMLLIGRQILKFKA